MIGRRYTLRVEIHKSTDDSERGFRKNGFVQWKSAPTDPAILGGASDNRHGLLLWTVVRNERDARPFSRIEEFHDGVPIFVFDRLEELGAVLVVETLHFCGRRRLWSVQLRGIRPL